MSEASNLPSSSREMRNRAEKQRRDKLNAYISELYNLVPSAASAPRKLDKTSTLRLSANFLRIHQNVDLRMKPYSRWNALAGHLILEKLDSFLMAVSCCSGKILYVSDRVEKLLGHAQVDMMGYQLSYFVHQADQEAIEKRLGGFAAQAASNPGSSSDSDDSGQVYSFECRIAGRQLSRGEPTVYERCVVSGKFRGPRRRREWSDRNHARGDRGGSMQPSNGYTEPLFIAVVRLLQTPNTLPPLTMIQATKDEYFTQHTPTGTIIRTDHRIATVAGYMTGEVTGMSAFDYIHPEDQEFALKAQSLMLTRNEGMVTYRLKTSTGRIIYLRSQGFIQYDDTTKEITGYFCINTQVNEEEGKKQIQALRKMLENLCVSSLPHPALTSSPVRPAIEPAVTPPPLEPPAPLPPRTAPRNGNGYHHHHVNGTRHIPRGPSSFVSTSTSPGTLMNTSPANLSTSPRSELMCSPSDCSSVSSSSYGNEELSAAPLPSNGLSSPVELPGVVTLSYIPFPWKSNPDPVTALLTHAAPTAGHGSIESRRASDVGQSGPVGGGNVHNINTTAGILPIVYDNRWDAPNNGIVIHPAVSLVNHHQQQPMVAIIHHQQSTTISSVGGFQVPVSPNDSFRHKSSSINEEEARPISSNQLNSTGTTWSPKIISPIIKDKDTHMSCMDSKCSSKTIDQQMYYTSDEVKFDVGIGVDST